MPQTTTDHTAEAGMTTLREIIDCYRSAAITHVSMEGVHYRGVSSAMYRTAWEEDRATLAASPAPSAPAAVPEELRRLSEKATPGPWFARGDTSPWIADSPDVGRHKRIVIGKDACYGGAADCAFICEAVNFVRTLAAAPAAPPADGGTEGLREADIEAACRAYSEGKSWLNSWGEASAEAEHRCRMKDALAALSSHTPVGAAGDPVGENEPTAAQLRGYGYAPGNYTVRCKDCRAQEWNLDKLALRCRPCATTRWQEARPAPAAVGRDEADDAEIERILGTNDEEIVAGVTPEKIKALEAERDAAVAATIAARSDAIGWHQDYKQERRQKNAALATRPASPAPAASAGGAEPCAWAGGNDTCYCRTCGEEYRYGREDKPPCPKAALTPAAPVIPAGREEIAKLIAYELGVTWAHLSEAHFEDEFCREDFRRATDAILAARPVAEGVAPVVEDVRDPDLHDAPWMRLKANPVIAGPVIEECKSYITIEHLTTDTLTRTPDAFEPCPSPYAATSPAPPTHVDPAARPGASAIKGGA